MAQNSLVNMLNVPARLTARKRSGSFSEVLARSLSTERPGTPRPKEMVRLIIFSFYDHPLPSTISLDLGLKSNVELRRLYNTKYLRKLLDILTSLLVASRNLWARNLNSLDLLTRSTPGPRAPQCPRLMITASSTLLSIWTSWGEHSAPRSWRNIREKKEPRDI